MAIKIGVIDSVIRETGTDALKAAKGLGFDGVEFFVPAPWDDDTWLSSDYQAEVRATAEEVGAGIPSLALAYMNGNPVASPVPAARHAVLQSLIQYIEVAKAVGAGQLLLAFYGEGELAFGRQKGLVVEQLKAAAPAAEEAGVKLGIESTLTSAQYLYLIEQIGSPAVNVYLDMCNPYNWCLDTAEQLRSLGQHVGQFHFKEGKTEGGASDLGEGFNDWDAIAAALKEIGYDGWGILETSSLQGDPKKDAQRNLQKAREIAAKCE